MRPDDHDRGALVVLLGLPRLGPVRLHALLDAHQRPAEALDAIRAGRVGDADLRCGPDTRRDLLRTWRAELAGIDPLTAVARHRDAGVALLLRGDPAWPAVFDDDPEPPAVLFVRGDPSTLTSPAVAIVGTRRCTALGSGVARELGHDLALAGVRVVSGLALGIDGAAHRGVLEGGGTAIGVVATGLDVVYPSRHRRLWDDVAASGALVSEVPLGTPAERWRFPARNRLIAALADAVVVVESRREGGSMHTVDAALERDTEVLAVPGPVRAAASSGPNQLLHDGCGVVRDATDVLVALGTAAPVTRSDPLDPGPPPGGLVLAGDDRAVAGAVGWPASSLDAVVAAAGMPLERVLAALTRLEVGGVVERMAEGYRRTAP